jgi:hypothetical protein
MADDPISYEDRIQDGCSAFSQNLDRGMAFYAREFEVEYHALQRRLRGIPCAVHSGSLFGLAPKTLGISTIEILAAASYLMVWYSLKQVLF